jgi:PTS system mannose-specific IIB component
LYSLGVPSNLDVEFLSVDEAVDAVESRNEDGVKTLLLVGNVNTLVRLCERTKAITEVNIGGVHEGDGRSQRLKYVYLRDDEAAQLRQLRDGGVKVTAQDVPTAKKAQLDDWL